MKKLKQTYVIDAPVVDVWKAFVDSKEINSWGGGPAKISDENGFEFELWGGDIWGKNIEVIPQKRLVQEWFGGKWDKPSVVTFTFSKKGSGTKVDLSQIDVPDNELDEIEKGWVDYYMNPMKEYLEG